MNSYGLEASIRYMYKISGFLKRLCLSKSFSSASHFISIIFTRTFSLLSSITFFNLLEVHRTTGKRVSRFFLICFSVPYPSAFSSCFRLCPTENLWVVMVIYLLLSWLAIVEKENLQRIPCFLKLPTSHSFVLCIQLWEFRDFNTHFNIEFQEMIGSSNTMQLPDTHCYYYYSYYYLHFFSLPKDGTHIDWNVADSLNCTIPST